MDYDIEKNKQIQKRSLKYLLRFYIPTLGLWLLFLLKDFEAFLTVSFIFFMPTLILTILIICELIVYFNPYKLQKYDRLKDKGTIEEIDKYINEQIKSKLLETDQLILTPELLLDKKSPSRVYVLKDINKVYDQTRKGNLYPKVSIVIKCIDDREYTIYLEEIPPQEYKEKVNDTINLINQQIYELNNYYNN